MSGNERVAVGLSALGSLRKLRVVEQGRIPGLGFVGRTSTVGADTRLIALLLLIGALAGGGKAAPPALLHLRVESKIQLMLFIPNNLKSLREGVN